MHEIQPHHDGCPCDAHVESPPEAALLPCPAIWDAWNTGLDLDGWKVRHRTEGSASLGVKVWYRWERGAKGDPT